MERIKNLVAATRTYLREVVGELRKVVWPGREQTLKLTGIVVAMVTVIAGFFYLLDLPLGAGMVQFLGR